MSLKIKRLLFLLYMREFNREYKQFDSRMREDFKTKSSVLLLNEGTQFSRLCSRELFSSA